MLQTLRQKLSHSVFFKLSLVSLSMCHGSSTLALPLSPGDRLEVSIPQETYFSRVYEVNEAGNLEIPYLGTMAVAGLEPASVEDKLEAALVEQKFFPPHTLQMTIQVLEWSPITVHVAGELFQPGAVQINLPFYPEASFTSPEANQITGEFPYRRYLTDAIKGGGGVLPTANIKEVRLIRNGQEQIFDVSGALTGKAFTNVPLIAGDRIIVPAAAGFQAELVRPSAITPPGIKVFVSNLTIPANNNASSSIDNQQEGITFPYGARFSHAAIATNCAGGIKVTNAKRKAILMRVDRLTGETTYLERSIEDLMRDSHHNDDNPLLMPRDGVACYDSTVTSVRDVFKALGDILIPFRLLF
ncbi:MAG: polysaccharide biosynthesis/export family protein [Cyanobacteria bacterium J06621_8]